MTKLLIAAVLSCLLSPLHAQEGATQSQRPLARERVMLVAMYSYTDFRTAAGAAVSPSVSGPIVVGTYADDLDCNAQAKIASWTKTIPVNEAINRNVIAIAWCVPK